MINLKRILLAIIISCSIGAMSTYSTIATAAGTARANKDVIQDILKSLNEALAAIENNQSKESILSSIQNARQFSKEINVGSLGAIVDRGSSAIVSASQNIKSGDKDATRESLNSAVKEYTEMSKKTL